MAKIHQPLHGPMSEIRLVTILPAHYDTLFALSQAEKDESAKHPNLVHCRLENVCLDDTFLLEEHDGSRSGIWPGGIWAENTNSFGHARHPRVHWRYTWGDFVALSYSWGDPTDTCDIVVNGHIAKVTRNLEAALRVLRDKFAIQAGCKLWIDAICIQQDNFVEKGREIGRMRSIYQKAADVLVWLGPEANDSGNALDFMNALTGCFEVGKEEQLKVTLAEQLKLRGPSVWNSISSLMYRSYWPRLWVVQEIAMGSHHTPVLIGNRTVSIDDLDKTVYYFNNAPKDSITATIDEVFADLSMSFWDLENAREYWHWDVVHSLRGYQKLIKTGRVPELNSLLRYCRQRETSELKDKVFGMLGLLDDSISSRVNIDYSLPASQILSTFAQICIEETSDLEVFCECAGWGRPWANKDFPSWVPDYTNSLFRALTGDQEPKYNAGGSYTAARTPRFSHDGKMLTCLGVRVDVLDGLSSSYWSLKDDGSPHVADQYEGADPPDIAIDDDIHQPSQTAHPYGTEEGLADAVWRSMVGNRNLANDIPDPAPAEWNRLLVAFGLTLADKDSSPEGKLGWTTSFIRRNADFLIGGQTLKSLIARQGSVKAQGKLPVDHNKALDEALERVSRFALFRRLVTTKEKGLVGMSPHFIARGDVVYCFPGCSFPMLLREVPYDGEERKTYKIVTPIYIHGVMEGEAVAQAEAEGGLEEVSIW